MNSADRLAVEATEARARALNEGTKLTLGWLLDEVEETRGKRDEASAIRILIEDRDERGLFSAGEADKVRDLLDRELERRTADSLADTFSLTDILRLETR